jgi:DNA-directed RNA polymerase specialized sigma24 family protein
MEAVAATAAPADEALDTRAHAGDREAFRSLYAPHLQGVYDYVLRIVGERELATDVVRRTFATAWRSFPEQGNDVGEWLFATARTSALEALRYRRDRNGAEREALDFTRVDGNRVPDATVVFDKALAELVWDAAAALPREEYSLLALHVRHDVDADATRVRRLREVFDEHVTSELLAHRARHNCTELEILVAQDDRQRLLQHVRRCTECRESVERFVSPTDVLGGLAAMPAPRSLRREIFGRARRPRLFGVL